MMTSLTMRKLSSVVALSAATALFCCGKDRGAKSAEDAKADVARLVEMTAKDVAEVERGLPEGAKKLTAIFEKELGKDGDPKGNVPAVRSALLKMRQQVPDLGIAKSTFFAFADPAGIAIRNDFEQDTMAGKDLIAGWPGLKPAVDGQDFVATTGSLKGGVPNPHGNDKEWVAAVPVKKADGSKSGLLVTGWTYRRFAYHLQVTAQREVQDALMRAGDKGKMPILYVCLFDKEGLYCAASPGVPPVPEVNEKALETAKLYDKTAGGTAAEPLKITDRDFGWAAARTPKLGPDVGVAVLRSDI
ncbi:MAG: hypothetical protein U0270_12445 [Labilithrix sp.]